MTFTEKPLGLYFQPYDNNEGVALGAEVRGYTEKYEALETIIRTGSKLVSVGHHHVSEMKFMEIMKVLEAEPLPCKLGFTYDATEVAKRDPKKMFLSDHNVTRLKSGRGKILVQITEKPIGIKLREFRNGLGAVVSELENPALKHIIPIGSRVYKINKDEWEDVLEMNYKSVCNRIDEALDQCPFYLKLLSPLVKTPYGLGTIIKIREDGMYVIQFTGWGGTAYLQQEKLDGSLQIEQLTAQELEELNNDILDAADVAAAEEMPEVDGMATINPMLLRMTTKSDISELDSRRKSQMMSSALTSFQLSMIEQGDDDDVDSDDLDEFEEWTADPPEEEEQKEMMKSPSSRGTSSSRLKAADLNINKDDEDAEDVTTVGMTRDDWVLGTQVEILRSTGEWTLGAIKNITNDADGEWLTVVYDVEYSDGTKLKRSKETQRQCEDIRPLAVDLGSMVSSPVKSTPSKSSLEAMKIQLPEEPSALEDLTEDQLAEQLAAIVEKSKKYIAPSENVELSPVNTQVGI